MIGAGVVANGIYVFGQGHLAETLARAARLRGMSILQAPGKAELLFVAPDVLDHGDAEQLAAVEEHLRAAVDASRGYMPIIVVSQVPPGWMREHASVGYPKRIFYQVDTIIVRSAVARMVRPEQIVVGCADPIAPLPLTYQEYLAAHDCPVRQMPYESAELAKCAINYALAKQIEVAKDLLAAADACGAYYADVAAVLRGDARIGPDAYLWPGSPNQHLTRDVDTIRSWMLKERRDG